MFNNTLRAKSAPAYAGIPTKKFNITFRSKLESQWATFFAMSGIRWHYEPRPVQTRHGRYLPDFYLPDVGNGLVCEVKPLGLLEEDYDLTIEKLTDAAQELKKNATVLRGSPKQFCVDDLKGDVFMSDDGIGGAHELIHYDEDRMGWDHGYLFCACPYCWKVGYEHDGRGERVCSYEHSTCPTRPKNNAGDKGYSATHPRVRTSALFASGVNAAVVF